LDIRNVAVRYVGCYGKNVNYFVRWFSVNFPASMIPSEKEQFEEESHLGTCKLEFNFIKTDIHKVCSMALELIKVLVISEYIFDYELQ
jgi:hypothetical protein